MNQVLSRYARPVLLGASLLLVSGALLALFHLLLLGWVVYAIGHALAILGFLAIAQVNRALMDPWTWLGLIVLETGLVLAMPGIASIGSTYATSGEQAQLIMPIDAPPFGFAAELISWVGVAFFGLAARGARALPRGMGWVFVAAAVIGVLGDLRLISAHVWFLAVILLASGLLGVATSLRAAPDHRATASA
jgi:hypothetical protein